MTDLKVQDFITFAKDYCLNCSDLNLDPAAKFLMFGNMTWANLSPEMTKLYINYYPRRSLPTLNIEYEKLKLKFLPKWSVLYKPIKVKQKEYSNYVKQRSFKRKRRCRHQKRRNKGF